MDLVTKLYIKLMDIDIKQLNLKSDFDKNYNKNSRIVEKNLKVISKELKDTMNSGNLHEFTADRINKASNEMQENIEYIFELTGDKHFSMALASNYYLTKMLTFCLLDLNNSAKDTQLWRAKLIYRYQFLRDAAVFEMMSYYAEKENLLSAWDGKMSKLNIDSENIENINVLEFTVKYVNEINAFFNAVCDNEIGEIGSLLYNYELKSWFDVEYTEDTVEVNKEDVFNCEKEAGV